jgi:hypothetical protein
VCEKSLAPPGFDPRTVQPVAQSLYRLSYRARKIIIVHYAIKITSTLKTTTNNLQNNHESELYFGSSRLHYRPSEPVIAAGNFFMDFAGLQKLITPNELKTQIHVGVHIISYLAQNVLQRCYLSIYLNRPLLEMFY